MRSLLTFLLFIVAANGISQKRSVITVHFNFDKYDIRPETAKSLDSLISILKGKTGTYTLELYGHCDSIGGHVYNDGLSQNRTGAVKKYLAEKDISSDVIKEAGFGKRQPLNDNITEQDRFANRRVDIVVLMNETIPVPVEIETISRIPEKVNIANLVADSSVKIGSTFILQHLNFYGGRHVLLPASYPVLTELLEVLKNNPTLKIAIEGHICCLPDNQDGIDIDLGTKNLSEMRAKTVYEYLVKNGIAENRLTYKGFGHRFPLASYPEKTAEEMTLNRRVEIKIVEK